MARPRGRADVDAHARARARAEAKRDVRRRRAEAPWFEWTLEEFARYLFGLGVLAALVFAPLQMADVWLPVGRPPIVDPAVVAALAMAFEIGAGILAFLAYRFAWGEGGAVDRAIARHRAGAGEARTAKPITPAANRPSGGSMELREVEVENPEHLNVIVGQTHFIKTAEDLYEALVNSVPGIQFGLAFCEASGPRLVRAEGTDPALKDLAARNAMKIGAGHAFVILVRNAYPVNLLRAIRDVPEVVAVFAATANPLTVLVAETARGRGIVGVVDGEAAKGVESAEDVRERRALVRRFGYKL